MKVVFVHWSESLFPDTSAWDAIAHQVTASSAELLVTNELPFGPWIAGTPNFDETTARRSVECHEAGLRALCDFGSIDIVSSRPV